MPLHTTASHLLFEARKNLHSHPRPCQLCYFKYEVSDCFLEWLLEQSRKYTFIRTEMIQNLLNHSRVERLTLLAQYWEALGFQQPLILESNSRHGETVVDFNLDLRRDFGIHEQFDLVDNSGVTEHVFDQRAVFENIHNLCRTGGLMTHRIPMYGVLNITLYGITPRYLYDLAKANRYDIEFLSVANRWGDYVPVKLENRPIPEPFINSLPAVAGCSRSLGQDGPRAREMMKERDIPRNWRLPGAIDLKTFLGKSPILDSENTLSKICQALLLRGEWFRPLNAGEIYVAGIFRKVHDEPFRIPYQGNNLTDIESPEMKERYRHQMEK